jgi:hypothetical protein
VLFIETLLFLNPFTEEDGYGLFSIPQGLVACPAIASECLLIKTNSFTVVLNMLSSRTADPMIHSNFSMLFLLAQIKEFPSRT